MIRIRLAHASAPRPRPRAHVVVEVAAAPPARPLRPVPLALGLSAPVSDGVPHRQRRLAATEAARGFSEGTFFLPGQIVDRRS
ncbi:hypothetical protein [Amaricoccus solimangrovi]|uniref:Uncharacterized protein n=1 Tax=Amaricoccus solimangrovi TaxID=2589815 RepID=A0A501WZK2_9RHOB|nr:hypothetical protein [Amaricoccus solimangrovi]TPE53197.1 hypothetical protein FJM51_04020 [Amaricoccus solimangrovi]